MAKRRRRTSSITTSTSSLSTSTSSSSTSTSSSPSTTLQHSNPQIVFGTLLAALCSNKPTSERNLVIQKTLNHLLVSLLSKSSNSILQSQQTLDVPLISLLPVILNSKCLEIACSGLEIVGAASLFSIEMNQQIASDYEIMKGLITAVSSSRRSISMAACNALLDLFTTSIGCSKILEFHAIENLIVCFLQVPKSTTPTISIITEEGGDNNIFKIRFMEDEYPILLLHLSITLINNSTFEQLEKVPKGLLKKLATYISRLWVKIRGQILMNDIRGSEGFYTSNIKTNHLAECLFRLSVEGTMTTSFTSHEVKKNIFDFGQNSFKSFIVNHWEQSPLLIKKPSNFSFQDNVFSPFSQFLRSNKTIFSFLDFMFHNLTSALPISSDELDIINFLNESRENIGCLLMYKQDIRVVKTLESKGEKHFFQGRVLNAHDILRCREAYNDGYTFALRGMEFRFKDIAAISEGLTFLFGQPSTGVNMYLTPPNSQGLARHRDDHCVLVCQIRGIKRWKIYPKPGPQLPRLYDNVDDPIYLEGENKLDGCKEVLLREGDILYIPRGFPHEACTVIDDGENIGNAEFSLHLTLAIEIEPPFEWEGFLHIALNLWGQNYKFTNHTPCEYSSQNLHNVAVYLMHISIKLIGDVDPRFRKACLIGADSFVSEDWLQTHQKSTFDSLLSKISSDSNFNDIVSNVEAAVRKNEDLFDKLRWICHLDQKMSSIEMEDIFHVVDQQKDKVEAAFMEVKSEFCNGNLFDDTVHHYNVLLEKYRITRKQYINGMLSLNCT